jgi:hypothetical protein
MSIKIEFSKAGIHMPMVTCEMCKCVIRKAEEGMACYGFSTDDYSGELKFFHKLTCNPDRYHGDNVPKYLFWHDLDVFFVWLTTNTKMDWKDARDRAKLLESI